MSSGLRDLSVPEPDLGSHFVATYPPFSCWDREGAARFRAELERPPSAGTPLGLYVHVPFCVRRCSYCYYLSYEGRGDRIEAYLDGLAREAELASSLPAIRHRPISFAYIGGGTPSLLSSGRIRRLLGVLEEHFSLSAARETSFECAPRTVTSEKLEALLEGGVSRVSMGVQQLDDDVLERNGRVHRVADVERAWKRIRAAGFPVVNLDLIVGLVGESDATFLGSVDRLIEMGPESVTVYQLELPLNTPLARAAETESLEDLPGWGRKRERLGRAFDRLEAAGYTLRSAYTAVKDPVAHRFVYQDEQYGGADLLGLGASSFSSIGPTQHQNPASLEGYLAAMTKAELPLGRGRRLTDDERAVREMVLQSKLGSVDRAAFRARHRVDPVERFAAAVLALCDAGMLRVTPATVSLTRRGLLHADTIVRMFFRPEHRGIRYS